MLTPKWQAPIASNREPTTRNKRSEAQRTTAAARDAVQYIADMEGRRAELAEAEKIGATIQTDGGGGNVAPTPSYGGTSQQLGSEKVQEL